ncbi:MAG TPA: thioredoxin [Pyrinomonadaceae bacterium]|nr:thioredoxin [Pyrinomonadaceae bacterium]
MAEKQIVRCNACGAQNRVDIDKVQQGNGPVCGRCKQPLPLGDRRGDKPVIVSDSTFAAEVEGSPLPVLLDLWAPWCAPCRFIAPVVEELASELAGRVRVAKLNVDDNPITAGRLNVRNIPTLVILRSGKEVDRLVGVIPKAEIRQRLEQVIRV